MSQEPFKPGDRQAAAYADLRSRILELDLLPGEIVSERELEGILQVSRSPIREALMMLERDGLVIRLRRGYRIAPIDIDEFLEVFEYREVIEAAAARNACLLASDEDLAALDTIMRVPLSESVPADWYHLSTTFHVRLAELSGNRFFVSGINDALTRIARVRWMHSNNAERRVQGHQAHLRILEPLLARDPDGTAQATADHVRQVRDDLVTFLRSTERALRGKGIRIG